MQTFQDTTTGRIWAFEDGVKPFDYPSTPATLSTTVIPQPEPTQDYVWSSVSQQWIYQPAPPVVPAQVTMRQARLALFNAGLLAQVDAIIAALPEPGKTQALIEWDYSSTVKRDAPLVAALAAGLTLNPEQVDYLFITAATL